MKIKGFIHCYGTEKGQHILLEQIHRLKESKLWRLTDELYVGSTGNQIEVPDDDKIIHFHSEENYFERVTLDRLYQECFATDCYVYYMHTKGASKPAWDEGRHWRHQMEEVIIDRHESCFEILQFADSCGPLGLISHDNLPFYAGNFWWSKSDHVRNLISPHEWSHRYTSRGSHERWAYETWITQEKGCKFFFLTSGAHLRSV